MGISWCWKKRRLSPYGCTTELIFYGRKRHGNSPKAAPHDGRLENRCLDGFELRSHFCHLWTKFTKLSLHVRQLSDIFAIKCWMCLKLWQNFDVLGCLIPLEGRAPQISNPQNTWQSLMAISQVTSKAPRFSSKKTIKTARQNGHMAIKIISTYKVENEKTGLVIWEGSLEI